MPHSAKRVLCTPVLRSLRSRSWLKAQMTDVRSAETCSSTCLIFRESAAPITAGLRVSTGMPSRVTGSYQDQELPDDFHADIAWYASRRPWLRSGVSVRACASALAACD